MCLQVTFLLNNDFSAVPSMFSNLNLLLNPDFCINQRNFSGNASYEYTVDRWFANDISVEKLDTHIVLTRVGTSNPFFIQRFEQNYYKQYIEHQQITMTIMQSDGSAKKGTVIAPTFKSNGYASVNISDSCNMYIASLPSGECACGISFVAAGSLSVKWIKLELGNISTPFIPPNPATELLKCQRYGCAGGLWDKFIVTDLQPTYVDISICLPNTIRTLPTFAGSLTIIHINGTSITNIEPTSVQCVALHGNFLRVRCYASINMDDHAGLWTVEFLGPCFFDAEII